MKRKIKRYWRHFKYWLARKMFPDNEMNFLVVPGQADIQITEITARTVMDKHLHSLLHDYERRDKVLKQMHESLDKYMEYSELWKDDRCLCKGKIYIVRERG